MKRARLTLTPALVLASTIVAPGCGSDSETASDAKFQRAALLGVKAYVGDHLEALADAADALQVKTPEPDADGWSIATDPAPMTDMRAAWKDARRAYERVEGAIAVLFPNLDVATDERYDGFLQEGPDANLFDDEGVIGVHAVERILWADQHPPEVVAFERPLTGYVPAAFPSNLQEATDFKTKLVARLVQDTKRMRDDFAPLALDTASAYRGVVGSMGEQAEKIDLASTGEAESRYADFTLGDMRANLEGGRAIFAEFEPWIASREGGPALVAEVKARFEIIAAAYAALPGDGLPEVPAGWNPAKPTAEHLATPYGQLFSLLAAEADPSAPTSLVTLMNQGADLIGIPVLPE